MIIILAALTFFIAAFVRKYLNHEPCRSSRRVADGFEPRPECGLGQGFEIQTLCYEIPLLDDKPTVGQIALRMRLDSQDCHEDENPLRGVKGAA